MRSTPCHLASPFGYIRRTRPHELLTPTTLQEISATIKIVFLFCFWGFPAKASKMINQFLFTKPKKFQQSPSTRRSSAQAMAKQFQKIRGPVSPSRIPMEVDETPDSSPPARVRGSSQRHQKKKALLDSSPPARVKSSSQPDERLAREFSRAKDDVARGKKPMEPSKRQVHSETEEDEPKLVKKSQKTPRQLSPEEYLNIFLARGFAGTRYPHRETCKKLGIDRDVEYLYEMGGLSAFMRIQLEAYKEETCHFLSSLQVHFYEDEPEYESDGGPGFITFTCRGFLYSLTIKEMDTLYGFRSGTGTLLDIDPKELRQLWSTIGDGTKPYMSARSKGSQIRSPVVRYLHKAIANTLFARTVTGTLNEGELKLLDVCLKDVLVYTREGLTMQGDTTNTSLTFVLLDQLLYYRDWALRMHRMNSEGELSIGGIITPILIACGVELTSEPYPPRWIDIGFLRRCRFLDHNWPMDEFMYKFTHPTAGEAHLRLPCTDITKVRLGENIDFSPPLDRLYNPDEEEPQLEENSGDSIHSEDDASEKFDFGEYRLQPSSSPALKEAHKRIGLLQKWNKFQGKTIAALKGTVKDLKGQMKEMRDQLKDFQLRFSAPSSKKVVLPKRVLVGSGSFREEPRPRASMEPPRASSFEPRQQPKQYSRQKKRRSVSRRADSSSQLEQEDRVSQPMTTDSTRQFEWPIESSSHMAYTRESMEDSISSFFSNP